MSGASVSSSQSHDSSTTGSHSPVKTSTNKRRSSKVYEPDLSAVTDSLVAELYMSPAPWTHKSLYGLPKRPPKTAPPPERFIVEHLAAHRRFIPDPRWWDRHGIDLPLGGFDKRHLMVERYGMRVPFPVETVYRWFEEILTLLRLRASALLHDSPWRKWPVPSLVSLLREHAWGDAPAQALLHMAQNKGLEQLVCLAHRWNLKLLHERYEWRPAGRTLVASGASEAAESAAVPPPRDARLVTSTTTNASLVERIEPRVDYPADPLPYASQPDWDDHDHPEDADAALAKVNARAAARSELRFGREQDALNARPVRMGGGAGTGRDSVVLTPYPGNSSNLQNSPAPSGGANSPITSASTDTGLGFLTATDRVMATMQVRGAARAEALTRMEDKNLDLLPPRPKGGWKHDAIQPEPEKDDSTPPWRLSAARRYPRSPAAKKLQLTEKAAAAQAAASVAAAMQGAGATPTPMISPSTTLPPMPSQSPRSPQPTNMMTSSSALSPGSPHSPDGSVNSMGSSTSGSQASYSTSSSSVGGGNAPTNRRRRRPRKGNVAFGSGLVDVKHVADGAFADSTGATRAGAFDNRPASPAKLSATARAKHLEMLQLQEQLAATSFYNDMPGSAPNDPHPHPSPLKGGSFNSKTTNLPPVSAATVAAAAAAAATGGASGNPMATNPSSSSSSSSSSSAFSLQRQSLAFGESAAGGAGGLPTDSFAGTHFTGMTQYDLWDDGSGSDQEEEEDPDMNDQERAALAAKKQAKRNHQRLEKLRFEGTFGGGYGFSDGQGIVPPTLPGSLQHKENNVLEQQPPQPQPLGASTLSFPTNGIPENSNSVHAEPLPFANFFPPDFGPYGGEYGNGETGSAEATMDSVIHSQHSSTSEPPKSNRSVGSRASPRKQGSAGPAATKHKTAAGASQTLPKVTTPQKGPPARAANGNSKSSSPDLLAPPLVSPLVTASSSSSTSIPTAPSASSTSPLGAPPVSRRIGRAAGTLPSLAEPISGGGGGLEEPINDSSSGGGGRVLLGGSERTVVGKGSNELEENQNLLAPGDSSLAQGSMASTVIWAGDEPSGPSRALSAQFASVARADPSVTLADPSVSIAESTTDSVVIEAGDSFTLSPRSRRHTTAAAPANASTSTPSFDAALGDANAAPSAAPANAASKGSPVAAFDLSAADGSVIVPPSFTAADRRAVKFLLEACAAGHINDLVDMFAAVGAGPLTEWVDGRRRGPLHYAASHGRAQTCLWLMGHGAHAFARDLDGRAPIHLAAAEGHEDALRALLNHPAARPRRPDPVDRLGRTPLHDACWRAQKYTAEALLRNGASVAARDAQGFTPIERASQGRRTALVEYLTRQQIIPLDYNLTFTQYHTYDEHKVLNAEKRESLIIKRAEDAKEKAEFAEAAAREAAAMDHFKRSGQVPRLVGLAGSSSQPGGVPPKEWATTIPEGGLHLGTLPASGWSHGTGAGAGGVGGAGGGRVGADEEPMGARAAAKAARRASRAAAKALKTKKRNPKQVPTLNSESALEHPTASAGGLDELLTESPAFPFPRAVHLRERRARDPDLQGDSDDDDDSDDSEHRDDDDDDEEGAFDSDSEDSIESDDYDEDPKDAQVTSTADEAVRLAQAFAATGGVAFGGAPARPVSPGGLGAPTPRTPRTGRSDSSHGATHRASAAAARAEAEDLASKVTQYMGGPPVDGVGAELKMLFSTLPVTAAAFARGKVSTPAFMHSMISPCIDPGDITGDKARTRLRLLEGRHRSMDPDAEAAARLALEREEDAQEEERLTGSRPTTANNSAKSTARQVIEGTSARSGGVNGGLHTGGSNTARSQVLSDEGSLTARSRDTPAKSNHAAAQAH